RLVKVNSVTTRLASTATVTVPAVRSASPTRAWAGATGMSDTRRPLVAFSVTVRFPTGTSWGELHEPALTSTDRVARVARVKVKVLPGLTPGPAFLQILTRPFLGGGGTFLLVKVTIVWLDRLPSTIWTLAVRLARSGVPTRRLLGVAATPTSWAPVRATSVTVAVPADSCSAMLHPPTGTVTVLVGLPAWLDGEVEPPGEAVPRRLGLADLQPALGLRL